MRGDMTVLLCLLVVGATDAAGQTAHCRLAPKPYGFEGTCSPDTLPVVNQHLRMRFADSVRIWMATGPEDRPPWRGGLILPGREVAFEIAPRRSGSRSALVFRSGLAWLLVKEWREVAPAGPVCNACDRHSRDIVLVLDLVNAPPANGDDVAILRSALAGLDGIQPWNRHENQSCALRETDLGLFCLLWEAVEGRTGRYHHRQPALELVRDVIMERWRERVTNHPIVDFNNHPATTMAEMRTVLQVALDSARAQAYLRPLNASITPRLPTSAQ